MSFTNQTTHYGLPQWIGSDKPTYLVDQNNAYQTIDSELYNANTASGEAVTTAQGAVTTAEGAASTAATALSTAQGAETTANTADGKADNAITLAQSAQTAAGAAQTAAEAAQEAAAGNSITNLANAYDPTLTYNVGDLVTQDGKLYQCITQVSTPEAFDINKWDDKTTSEVYYLKKDNTNRYGRVHNRAYTIAANTFATIADALEWIRDNPDTVFNLADDEVASNIAIYIDNCPIAYNNRANEIDSSSTSYLGGELTGTKVFNNSLTNIEIVLSSTVFANKSVTDANGTTFSSLLTNPQVRIIVYFVLFKLI